MILLEILNADGSIRSAHVITDAELAQTQFLATDSRWTFLHNIR